MNDDFNTPMAISVLFDLANEINKHKSPTMARQLKGLAETLGLLQRIPEDFLKGCPTAGSDIVVNGIAEEVLSTQDILLKIQARQVAKAARDFNAADRIRNELLAVGVLLEDRPGGQTEWRRV